MKEISRTPMLSAEDEQALLHQALEKGPNRIEARNKLTLANLRLLVKLAKRYAERYCETNVSDQIQELLQEGSLGLLQAVEKFQFGRGSTKFSTYATWWIRRGIQVGLMHQSGFLHQTDSARTTQRQFDRAMQKLHHQTDGKPAEEELASALGVKTKRLYEILKRVTEQTVRSMDEPLTSDKPTCLNDLTPDRPHPDLEAATLSEYFDDIHRDLNTALADLSPQEQTVLRLRYGLDGTPQETLAEVGKRFGVTGGRINQIATQALNKLRQHPLCEQLKEHLTRP